MSGWFWGLCLPVCVGVLVYFCKPEPKPPPTFTERLWESLFPSKKEKVSNDVFLLVAVLPILFVLCKFVVSDEKKVDETKINPIPIPNKHTKIVPICTKKQEDITNKKIAPIPITKKPIIQEDTRLFGKFKCSQCKKNWNSAFAYKNTTQACKTCKINVYAFELAPLQQKNNNEEKDPDKHHIQELCGKCKELGRNCSLRFTRNYEYSKSRYVATSRSIFKKTESPIYQNYSDSD